jgi:uncharacterized damage-inducible protein DinB
VPQLVEKVRTDAQQLRTAAEAVPAARFNDRPRADDWSANEVMAHIVKSSDDIARSIERTVAAEATASEISDRIERGAPERTAGAWLEEHQARRERLFAAVLAADPEAHLDVMMNHPAFGELNWRETLLFLRLHDIDHARQLEQIAPAQP